MGNFNVTDITLQTIFKTLGACFIYLQSVNLKSFTTITKQSAWTKHPMSLMPFF